MAIQGPGSISGGAAQTVGAIPAGTFFRAAGVEYVKVGVTGQTPAAGKAFALKLQGALAVQLDDTLQAEEQWAGLAGAYSFNFASRVGVSVKSGIEPAAGTLAEVAIGGLYDTGAAGGHLGVRCDVLDDAGAPIAPGAGNVWAYLFKDAAVAEVAGVTEIESYGDDAVSVYRVD